MLRTKAARIERFLRPEKKKKKQKQRFVIHSMISRRVAVSLRRESLAPIRCMGGGTLSVHSPIDGRVSLSRPYDFGEPEHYAEEAEKSKGWSNKAFGPYLIILAGAIGYDFIEHHEHHEFVHYPYRKIRTKPFPWAAKYCALLDFECKREALGGAKKAKAHH